MPKGYGGDEYSDRDVEILKRSLGVGGRATSGAGHNPPQDLSRIGNDPYLGQLGQAGLTELPADDRDLSEIRRKFEE